MSCLLNFDDANGPHLHALTDHIKTHPTKLMVDEIDDSHARTWQVNEVNREAA